MANKKNNNNLNANPFLETDKSHKDWYDSEVGMGKQRGKPKANKQNIKKSKGDFKKHKH